MIADLLRERLTVKRNGKWIAVMRAWVGNRLAYVEVTDLIHTGDTVEWRDGRGVVVVIIHECYPSFMSDLLELVIKETP